MLIVDNIAKRPPVINTGRPSSALNAGRANQIYHTFRRLNFN